ncbi:hypothetical protein CP967_31420 [Streptomyces nitrosporeus]|uniref:Uncharacterized protein n=1 Tax=Streptomyces nitrosporeus TaxID=28894 RepID=A0A5J6FH26_9ACTN|nr:hypothetical protein [Streptomyces nitrosporeus]QEU75879.1 hypothetical protein CP967_31420 [Streptomyces nitrosporeus]GGY89085.1 hypothetical protein GCM10010327_19820 [Streptomyces nitrosporeus]
MHVADHWHAYAWIGHARPDDNARVDPTQPVPPLEIVHWLKKHSRHVAETFDNTSEGAASASKWMRAGGEEHEFVSEAAFPLDARMQYVEDDIRRGADVVWGYYSKTLRYVSRALIACPRDGQQCPYGH